MEMNIAEYGEVINGEQTYKAIAKELLNGKKIMIGWTDEKFTHLDVFFTLGIDTKVGNWQRGMKPFYLYVGIIDHTFYGFRTDGIKLGGYVGEKLRLYDENADKMTELINGIITELNNSGTND